MPSVSRSIAVNTVGKLVPPLLALATQPLLALALGVDGRGALAAATAPLMLVSVILTLGVPDAFTYFIARRAATAGRLMLTGFLVLTVAGIAGTSAVALLAPALSDDPVLIGLIIVAGLGILPSLLVSGLRGVAAGHHAWPRVAAERVLGAVLRFLIVLALFVTGSLDPLAATIAFAVTNFASGVVYLWPYRPSAEVAATTTAPASASAAPPPPAEQGTGSTTELDEPELSEPELSEEAEPLPPAERRDTLLGYGLRVWLGTAVGALMARLDQVLMIPLTSAGQLGLYAVAYSISEVALMFNTAIREVMFSVESENPDERRTALASRLSTLVTFAVAAVVALCAPWAVPWLFGAGFADAVPVLWILLLAVVIGNPGSVAGIALSARGRPELRSASIGIAVVVNIVLVFALVPSLGAMGGAIATLVGNAVGGNLNIVFLRRVYGVPARWFYAFRADDVRELVGVARRLLRGRRTVNS